MLIVARQFHHLVVSCLYNHRIRPSSTILPSQWPDLSNIRYLSPIVKPSCDEYEQNTLKMSENDVLQAKYMAIFTITLFYVIRSQNSVTNGCTNYHRCRNKLLLTHRPNTQVRTVDTKSNFHTCTMSTVGVVIEGSMMVAEIISATLYLMVLPTSISRRNSAIEVTMAHQKLKPFLLGKIPKT